MKKYFTQFFSDVFRNKKKRMIFIAVAAVLVFAIVAKVAISVNFKQKEAKLTAAAENIAKKGEKIEESIKNLFGSDEKESENKLNNSAATKVGLNNNGGNAVVEEEDNLVSDEVNNEELTAGGSSGSSWTGINGRESDGNGHYAICPNYREVFGSYLTDAQINDWIARHPSGVYDNSEGWVVNTPYPDQPISSPELLAVVENTADRVARDEISDREAMQIIEKSYGGTAWVNYNPRNAAQIYNDVSARMQVDYYIANFYDNNPAEDTSFIKYYIKYDQSTDSAYISIVTVFLD